MSVPPLGLDALQEIRSEIAAAAAHPDRKLAEAKLHEWRLDVTDLLGEIDGRLGDQEKRERNARRGASQPP